MRNDSSSSALAYPRKKKKNWRLFFRENMEVFAWTSYEMLGISPEVICHRLNVDKSVELVIQRARRPTLFMCRQ